MTSLLHMSLHPLQHHLTVVSTVIFPEMMSARICSNSDLVSAGTLESKSWNSERSTPLFLRVPTYGSEEKEPYLAALMRSRTATSMLFTTDVMITSLYSGAET